MGLKDSLARWVIIVLSLTAASLLALTYVDLAELNSSNGRSAGPVTDVAKAVKPDFNSRRGVYLTSFALFNLVSESKLDGFIARMRKAGLNALVINVKNMKGEVTYDTRVALTTEIGARTSRLDLESLLRRFESEGIYTIARQVVFYDPKLAHYLRSSSYPWVLPDDENAVEYNLRVAEEVAAKGFDEIQFDYLRFPDDGDLGPSYEGRYQVINDFLKLAHQRLSEKINISVDVFGRTLWEWNVKKIDPIGQNLEEISQYVDIISPMVYPSHYKEHFRDKPHEVVKLGLESGLKRDLCLRPYLQAFERDIPANISYYEYIAAQIRAVEDLGFDGYLFWNPTSDYAVLWRVLEGVEE